MSGFQKPASRPRANVIAALQGLAFTLGSATAAIADGCAPTHPWYR